MEELSQLTLDQASETAVVPMEQLGWLFENDKLWKKNELLALVLFRHYKDRMMSDIFRHASSFLYSDMSDYSESYVSSEYDGGDPYDSFWGLCLDDGNSEYSYCS